MDLSIRSFDSNVYIENFGADISLMSLIGDMEEKMLDDFRIEWICRRTCEMFNIDRSIFVDMLERNNGFNEDLIDKFLNMNTALHERSYALIFHREDSTREIWQLIENIDEEEFDEV